MRMTEELFLQIYERYKNTVYSVIFNYVKNTEDTADLLQEVFISLMNSDVLFMSDEHMKAWLIRVASNKCKNFLRGKKHISDAPLPEDIPYETSESNNDLLRIVLTLPEKYRIPIHLFYYEDYSIKKIASVLDEPEATIKIRLKRGREKLGKILRKEDWI